MATTTPRHTGGRHDATTRGRLIDWALGFGLLSAHVGLLLAAATGLLLLNLWRSPGSLWVDDLLRPWAVVLGGHALATTLRAAARSRSRPASVVEGNAATESAPAPAATTRPRGALPVAPALRPVAAAPWRLIRTRHWTVELRAVRLQGRALWETGRTAAGGLTRRARAAVVEIVEVRQATVSEQSWTPPPLDPLSTWPTPFPPAAPTDSAPAAPAVPAAAPPASPAPPSPVGRPESGAAPPPPRAAAIDPLKAIAGAALGADGSAPISREAQWSWMEAAASSWLAHRELAAPAPSTEATGPGSAEEMIAPYAGATDLSPYAR